MTTIGIAWHPLMASEDHRCPLDFGHHSEGRWEVNIVGRTSAVGGITQKE